MRVCWGLALAMLSLFIRWTENKFIHSNLFTVAQKRTHWKYREMPIVWKYLKLNITNKTKNQYSILAITVHICLETVKNLYPVPNEAKKDFILYFSSPINLNDIFFDRMNFFFSFAYRSNFSTMVIFPFVFVVFFWCVCVLSLLFFHISQNSCIVNISAILWL